MQAGPAIQARTSTKASVSLAICSMVMLWLSV